MQHLAKLFKRSVTGAILEWVIEVEGNRYRTHSGQQGGVITTTEWTICQGKNTGKANATTPDEQAWRDARSKWQKKQDREGFVTDVNSVDTQQFISPMLAQNYDDRRDEIDFTAGVWVQCKLNGARCVATKEGLFSRKGAEWKSVPHIFEALKPFFAKYPNVVLDGELFNEDLRQDLGSIISLISKKNITDKILERSKELVKYHVYDTADTACSFQTRNTKLAKYVAEINNPLIMLVESKPVESSKQIDDLLAHYELQGHEGAIVRTNGRYEHKRSKHLLKYKSFVDDEFEIVDVIEGEGNLTNKVGAFVLKDRRGVKFNSSPTGSHEYWETMWRDRYQLIGKAATVKYKELTPEKNGEGGVPSFGKVIAVRNYEG